MKDYYVSCSKYDEEAAKWIEYQISSSGFSTILNPWDYLPGEDFLDKMGEATPLCKKIIILISTQALSDIFSTDTVKIKFLLGESELENNSVIVLIGPCEIKQYFKGFQYIDLVDLSEKEARERLLTNLEPQPEKIILPPPFWGITKGSVPEHAEISSKPYSKAQIIKLRKQEYQNNLKIILQDNYHMQLSLETEVIKEIEIEDPVTRKKIKTEMLVWQETRREDILKDDAYFVLVNPSGMGKTIFLTFLGGELLEKLSLYNLLPLNLTASEIESSWTGTSIKDYLMQKIEKFYTVSRTDIIKSDWSNLIFLIDALDQAKNPDYVAHTFIGENRKENFKNARIIISSRENTAYKVPQDFKRIRLKLPEKQEIKFYLKEDYSKLEGIIQTTGELVKVPVLLEMLRTTALSDMLKGSIFSRSLLYEHFVNILINKEREKPRYFQDSERIKNFYNYELKQCLSKVAFFSLNNREILEIEKENLLSYGLDEEKKEALLRVGILLEIFEDKKAKLLFRHQSFQAYFAACFIANQSFNLFEKLASNLVYFYSDVWLEVIRFYIGIEKSPKENERILNTLLHSEKKETTFIKDLRLLQAVVLASETRLKKEKALKLLKETKELIEGNKGYGIILLSWLERFNTANEEYRKFFIQEIIRLLTEGEYDSGQIAAEVLGEIVSSKHTSLLMPLLKEEDTFVRGIATKILGKIDTPERESLLSPLFKNADAGVRKDEALVLGKIITPEHMPLLIPLLKDADAEVRRATVETLGKIVTSKHVSLLIPLLKDTDEGVRILAAKALGKIVTPKHMPLLIPLLKDADAEIRRVAVETLGKIVTPKQVSLLIPLLKDTDEGVRILAAEALGKIVTPKHMPLLIPLLKDAEAEVRRVAVEVLGKIVTPEHESLLSPLLKDADAEVRRATVETLGKTVTPKQVSLLIPLLKDADAYVKRAVAEVLGKIITPEHVSLLIPLLNNVDAAVRRVAAEALGKIGTPEHVSLFIPLFKDTDEGVRILAAEALGKIGTPEHETLLSPLLKDADAEVRMLAALALGKIGTPEHESLLSPLLNNADAAVRRVAVEALGKIGTPEHVSLLIPLLKDVYEDIRSAVAKVLGQIGTPEHLSLLTPLFEDKDRSVREAAAGALREIVTVAPEHVSLLMPLLKDEDAYVKRAAAEALGKIVTPEHVSLLIPLLHNKDWPVRRVAAEVLDKIGAPEHLSLLTPLLKDYNWSVVRAAARAIENIYKKEKPPVIDITLQASKSKNLKTHYPPPAQTTWHILHISDIHYDPKYSWDIRGIFKSFLERLKAWRKVNQDRKIDMVFLTGDVAWSGDEAQFVPMEKKIESILEVSGCQKESFFVVPGNHDLENFLADPHPCGVKLKKIYSGKLDLNEQILNKYANYDNFLKMLENYNGFVSRMGLNHSSWQRVNGEVKPWYVKKLKDSPLAVIGLNSPLFISEKYHKHGQVKMGTRQFEEALSLLEEEKVQFIILTHHPLNWFDEKEQDDLALFMHDNYVIHLCGHSHKHKNGRHDKDDGRTMLSFNIGSIYGKMGIDDLNSFEILSVDFEEREVKAQIFTWDRDDKRWYHYVKKRANPYPLPSALRPNLNH